jgi:peptidoglycan/LPS O-acetylase OafA/YrhL
MRRIGFPPSENELPNQAGEQPWQTQYVLWSFGLSLLAAILITYLVEKPAARGINRLRQRKS